jgi:hypothetical protein
MYAVYAPTRLLLFASWSEHSCHLSETKHPAVGAYRALRVIASYEYSKGYFIAHFYAMNDYSFFLRTIL